MKKQYPDLRSKKIYLMPIHREESYQDIRHWLHEIHSACKRTEISTTLIQGFSLPQQNRNLRTPRICVVVLLDSGLNW